ncbi:aa3-type cytochrome c oxidase subunit IV [Sinisalibacter aestuarii]|uniref:Cytochrome c oxidase subunit IV bacterial aa3 type domain-containing protein n=1 Tax=Sinisalibacter aestuarii TaxID=2949426 RepID=A0ABQ5LXE4_9RHOB|nr:aa3-type cytochrome c oxidase subunit IV [Sinisalibacter aestuarii]GKY88762.1 hypothetical protein STA1M1_26310 [Sinisalibacter aestuarii]
MAEHQHGTMDTRVQEKTYEGFIKITVRSVIAIFAILIFMAIFNA